MKPNVIQTSIEDLADASGDPSAHIEFFRAITKLLGNGPYFWYQTDYELGLLLGRPLPPRTYAPEEALDFVNYFVLDSNRLEQVTDPDGVDLNVPGVGQAGTITELVDLSHLISVFTIKQDTDTHEGTGAHLRQVHQPGDTSHTELPGPQEIADQLEDEDF